MKTRVVHVACGRAPRRLASTRVFRATCSSSQGSEHTRFPSEHPACSPCSLYLACLPLRLPHQLLLTQQILTGMAQETSHPSPSEHKSGSPLYAFIDLSSETFSAVLILACACDHLLNDTTW